MFEKSEQVNELGAALAKAQASIKNAAKDGHNPHFDSHFATLSSVWDACREPLVANGLSVVQMPEMNDGKLVLRTVLIHSSGQFLSSTLALVGDSRNMQSLGSAISYARRYSLAAMVGVCPEDDDGEGAMQRGNPSPANQKPAPSRTSPVKTAPTTADDLADDAFFVKAIDQAFASMRVGKGNQDKATAAVLHKKGAAELKDLSLADRNGFYNAIMSGAFNPKPKQKAVA